MKTTTNNNRFPITRSLLFVQYFSHKVIEQIEQRNSALREELVELKEHLNKTQLERDCLTQEQTETADALSKVEMANAELGQYDSPNLTDFPLFILVYWVFSHSYSAASCIFSPGMLWSFLFMLC